ncbi:histidinol-phosphate transaminase [Flavobacteriaceae bacterium]|nr:histidinol-phosphate transaminase [Flavobacteriaceae bacterium]
MKRSINIDALTRPTIQAMQAYRSARSEFVASDREMILLDANENPFETGLNRYPDPMQTELKERLAKVKAVEPSHIFLGNGSDELINLLMVAFCEPKEDEILLVPPTFGMYQVSANLNGLACVEVPLISGFQLNVSEILAQATDRTKMIFIPTPNNPTGNRFPMKNIKAIVAGFPGLVVVDEAYAEFSPGETAIDWLADYHNVVVLQTFSKAQGLAGARVGMAFAHPDIIGVLNKIKAPYNLNVLSQQAVFDRLDNADTVASEVQLMLKEKGVLVSKIQQIRLVKEIFPSDANFILIRVDDSQLRYKQLIDKGIVVRNPSNQYACENTLRISIGTAAQNKALIAAFKTMDQ